MNEVTPSDRPSLLERSSSVLGISIVNYFSHESVSFLLNSLADFAQGTRVLVTVVDNSQDPHRQEYKRLQERVARFSNSSMEIEVIAADRNLGYGAGNNVAIAHLINKGSTLLWVLNPDTLVRGSALELLEEAARSTATLWSTLTEENSVTSMGLGQLNTLTGQARSSSSEAVSIGRFTLRYPGGHSILLKAETWHRLRGFDEDYFLFMEEADLAVRSSRLRLPIGTLSSISVQHNQGLTTGSSSDISLKSLVAFTEATKSRIVFFRKFYPLRLPVLVLMRLAYMARVLLRGNAAGAKAIARGIFLGLAKKLTTGVTQ